MVIKVIGSNSSGNCYVLESENECLIIDAGIHTKEIFRAIDYNISKIVGCIVTHEHLDHFRYVNKISEYGINVYGSDGTLKGLKGHRYFSIKPDMSFMLGNFKITPFLIKHDAREPFGFIINHFDCGNILFITDSKYTQYKFENINHIIVESNHSRELIDKKMESGALNEFLYKRLINSHMSIETCLDLIIANDSDKLLNIILIHLSDSNSNELEFIDKVIKRIGKKVFVADKGNIIDIGIHPF